tara:strand:+ start:916 stop:1161 length:246 start_codon:yes stop_codon:yes gene_type:complete
MESNIDKYSHKLSLKNGICYETARQLIEKTINKIDDNNNTTNEIVKSAYKFNTKKLKGGDPFYHKYLKYKKKYLQLKNKKN